ncbi:MAG: M1 family peptidase [Bacteroidetes bacterium]|nr:MAG: M1 family peptidase [Bacteroidota bacterium]
MFSTPKLILSAGLALCLACPLTAQTARWQQKAEYQMDIDFDTQKHQFKGKQKLTYTNNSPDTLTRVFYHLYYNAFQPYSLMDVRSRWIADPDPRVRDRIVKLKPEEEGYQKINALKQDGQSLKYSIEGTILEVELAKPILPTKKVVFEMDFEAQVPAQIRRTGRNNKEGIDYSMSQWYPKLCEYDYQGWHPNPYVGREFHGVWGDFDVKISIDSSYTIGATGYLQNAQEVGKGYETQGSKVKRPNGSKLTWHFKAPEVHDFAWGADPNYTHTTAEVDGITLHFFYQTNKTETVKNWKELPRYAIKAFQFMNKTFGKYPYKQYSFVQGGDGGMEYPMMTLMLGDNGLGSTVGTAVHELIHSWFQGVLATNESLYAWMDEGFNSYAGNLFEGGEFPHEGNYDNYFDIIKRGIEEPLSTHADHFNTNSAYSMSAYSKGCVFLAQLGYVVGEANLSKTMLQYFNTWKMKHPNDNDFIRVAEKVSGLELDWYKEYFVYSTHTIDYSIKQVEPASESSTFITLERVGRMPMPLDIEITYKDGSKEQIYIPIDLLRGEKPSEVGNRIVKADWGWVYPTYRFEVGKPVQNIKSIEIDKSMRMADVNRKNNVYPSDLSKTFMERK